MKSNNVPTFAKLKPSSKASSKTKQKNTHKDTRHEILLRKELWRSGLRYRKNVISLIGKPDIVFSSSRVIVFCDGDFWHGRNWKELKSKLKRRANPKYWIAKIAYNIERDKKNNMLLEDEGWHVIRLWETDIKRDPKSAAELVKKIVDKRKNILDK